jgi:hypothetical protein
MNAISTPSAPHTVRVPAELRELVAVMLERGEIAPGEVVGTLQRAMRGGLAAALEADAPPPRPKGRRRRLHVIPEAVALARLARLEGVARAVKVARAHIAAGGLQRTAVDALNDLGLLNTRRLVAVPWTVFSLARALSMPSVP